MSVISNPHSLGKNERLRSRKLIGLLFDQGEAINFQPFRLLFRQSALARQPNNLQAGFAVSARNFRKAVDRNRVKRLSKEAYRLNKPLLSQAVAKRQVHLDIFIIYVGRELPEWNTINQRMEQLLAKLINKINEYPA